MGSPFLAHLCGNLWTYYGFYLGYLLNMHINEPICGTKLTRIWALFWTGQKVDVICIIL